MKKSKRDVTKRAFSKGYQFGIKGKSKEQCPHSILLQRQAWNNGWREGWKDRIKGGKLFPLTMNHG